ncbi:YybH family protein [Paenibacillaceae bacterium WGS1546]|uniref:YybH family protein n=1 Tax=Cohnella sp. WGS1546 TaxID=3366810 RepID=UPI00372D82A9
MAQTPIEVIEWISDKFTLGDVDILLEVYEPNAVMVAQPGVIVNGLEGVRAGLLGMLSLHIDLKLIPRKVLQSGDIALVISEWTMTKPGTGELVMSGQSSDVVRQQPDGTWLMVIDNPHGLGWALEEVTNAAE